MPVRRRWPVWSLLLSLACSAGSGACGLGVASGTLPAQLAADEFWRLSTSLSEPPGEFRHSDNLLSNELLFVHALQRLRPRGGVYVGVGPEQNFSYIARLEPAMAFIIDIRQENRSLHLLYKALFETSPDRVVFLSRLFSRELSGLSPRASVYDLFAALGSATASTALRDATLGLVKQHLLETHRLPLADGELNAIQYVLQTFSTFGPDIEYGDTRPGSDPRPSYRELMTARDLSGESRNYLSSDDAFQVVRALHAKNLIVPVIGDFGTRHGAIARVGEYVRGHGSLIAAFYGSNVEVWLSKQQTAAFCDNLATLPVDGRTSFINSRALQPLSVKLRTCATRLAPGGAPPPESSPQGTNR